MIYYIAKMPNVITFWFYNLFILVIGTLAVYFSIKEIRDEKALLMAGSTYSLRKNPIEFLIIVTGTLICGFVALVYLLFRIIGFF